MQGMPVISLPVYAGPEIPIPPWPAFQIPTAHGPGLKGVRNV